MPKRTPSSNPPDASRDDVSGAAVETVARKSRRHFSASEKLHIVKAADAALASGERGAVAALLRNAAVVRATQAPRQNSPWAPPLT